MKFLLDENLPHKLRDAFKPPHEAYTVTFLRWNGLRNGRLLQKAAEHGFDALVTGDRGMEYEQNQEDLPIAVIVLVAADNRVATLEALVPALVDTINDFVPKAVMRVGSEQ